MPLDKTILVALLLLLFLFLLLLIAAAVLFQEGRRTKGREDWAIEAVLSFRA